MNLQSVKDALIRRGPGDPLVRAAVKAFALTKGFRVGFQPGKIALLQNRRKMILHDAQLFLAPAMMEAFPQYFQWIEAKSDGRFDVLDFSVGGFHKYLTCGESFSFPGIPEDYSLDRYTRCYRPALGQTVFDIGAHAGLTSYLLAKLVGPSGRVIAFEPDATNYEHLLRNIELHALANVTPVQKAVSRTTGRAMFNMDGTMAAGLSEHLIYTKTGRQVVVETLSFEDACARFGTPQFVKADIEGAEVSVVEGALPFLRQHPVHFAFESNHRLRDGSRTWTALERMLASVSYSTVSSAEFGEMFTWAAPPK